MHIARVAVTLALAASTTNALPWIKSRGDPNAPGVNADNLDTTREVHGKGSSPDSMHPSMKMVASSNQPVQQEMMEDSSLSVSQQMFLNQEHDIKPDLAAAAAPYRQSKEMIQLTRATEPQLSGEGSVMSSCSSEMPAVQQKAMDIQDHGAATDVSRSENKINNFAVKARELFRVFGQAWDQRAKLEHGEQQQGTVKYTANANQDKSQVSLPTDRENPVNVQKQQAADSMWQAEKVRQVRNHESYNQRPENESADIDGQQHSAMPQNQNYARSHMDGSNVQAHEMEQMNGWQSLDREQHQEHMNMRETKCRHQQQQMQEQEQMQEQMQVRPEMAEDLQSAMNDIHR